jgi:hypothetical protein
MLRDLGLDPGWEDWEEEPSGESRCGEKECAPAAAG